MTRFSQPLLHDESALQAWCEQVTSAAETPWLARELLRRSDTLLPRFTSWHQRLRRLPRRTRRALQRRVALSLSGVALLFALGQGPVQAALIEVDGTTCNLVNAITAANTDTVTGGCPAGSGADILKLELPGDTMTLTQVDNDNGSGPNGLPVITSDITITGPGTIERDENAPDFRIFEVGMLGALTLEQITVRKGVEPAPDALYDSGGGGIFANGCDSLALMGSTIVDNVGDGVATSYCPLTISNSTISDNTGLGVDVNDYSGTLDISNSMIHNNQRGGVDSYGAQTTIEATTISGNTGGAGVRMFYGSITVIDSTISGNTNPSQVGAGGIDFRDDFYSTTIINSTISGNTTASHGGGINTGLFTTIINSTISGNTAAGNGGGIYNSYAFYFSLINTTITGNHAGNAGGGLYGGGLYNETSSELKFNMMHSLVSGNTATGAGAEISVDFSQNPSLAHNFNIFGHHNQSGVVGFTPDATDIVPPASVFVSDILDPNLAHNGGPTQTHALVSGSLAIDAGEIACTDHSGNPIMTDQRGWSRVADGDGDGVAACDIGAFELQPLAVSAVTSSSFQAPNIPENTLDQDLTTRWSARGEGQSIMYDLGVQQLLNEVRIAWFMGDQRQAHFTIEVSMDASTWTEVFSGSSSGSTLELEPYRFAETSARYVRIVGHGNTRNDWNSITEVEMHRSIASGTQLDVVLANASSFQAPNVPENTLDQDLTTRWSARGEGQSIMYDLGVQQLLNEVRIAWFMGDQRQAHFDIEVSMDASTWTEVFSGSSSGNTLGLEPYRFPEVGARYVRIVGHGNTRNDWNSITEVNIYGP